MYECYSCPDIFAGDKFTERCWSIVGKEFGLLEGHLLIIRKALYCLRTSGLRWHDKLSDCLRDLGFTPSKAEPDIWIKRNKDHNIYKYVAVYVDDLAIAMNNCDDFITTLMDKYKFKLKGTDTITYHLGMDFFRDKDQILCMAPR